MAPNLTLYVNTDMVLLIPGITDRDGDPQDDAEVEVTLATTAGVEVEGLAWPALATNTDPGDYELALPDTLDVLGGRVIATVVITLADGSTRTVTAPVYVTEDRN